MNEPVVPTKKQSAVQFIKFLLFSISAGVIQLGVFTLLNELTPLNEWFNLDEFFGSAYSEYGLTYFIALLISVIWNFTFNRRFTFKSAANVPVAMLKVLGFYLVFTPLSIWWGVALTNAGWNNYLVLAGTMVINFVTEFLYDRFVVFRKEMYTNDLGKKELAAMQSAAASDAGSAGV